jgi:hypothetical protein
MHLMFINYYNVLLKIEKTIFEKLNSYRIGISISQSTNFTVPKAEKGLVTKG